ncbi:MAG: hypothetical protein FJ186_04320 [Gammaproteobacteria bacterium]|jgi:hypothetical protein|nr:hypothetical protein [Gammaproteobacteria bacterium]
MVLKHLKRKLIKNYRSDTDKLLDLLNQSPKDSASVSFEIEKHAKLHAKRDHSQADHLPQDDIWKNF